MANDSSLTVRYLGDASGAQQAADKAAAAANTLAGKAKAAGSTIHGALSSVFTNLGAAGALGPVADVVQQMQGQFDGLKEHGLNAGKAIQGIGLAAMGAGAIFTAAAQPDIDATNQLKQAIENTGQSYSDYQDKIDKVVKKEEKYGDTAAQTKGALQTLVQGTGSVTKALGLMGDASDLAAAKHESLGSAADQLVKIYAGKGSRTLASFGIDTTKLTDYTKNLTGAEAEATKAATAKTAADQKLTEMQLQLQGKTHLSAIEHYKLEQAQKAAKDAAYINAVAQGNLAKAHQQAAGGATKGTQALDLLSAKIKGQANAAADSLRGRLKALGAEVEDTAASIGQKYGPAITAGGAVMTAAVPVVKGVATGIGKLGDVASSAAGLVGKLELGQKAAAAASKIMAGAQAALNLVMDANPIVLVVAAIVALAAIFYEAYEHIGPFHDAVDALGRGFKAFGEGVVSVAKTVWNDTLKPVFGFIISIIKDQVMVEIDALKVLWQGVWLVCTSTINAFKSAVEAVYNWLKPYFFDAIKFDVGIVQSIWNGAWSVMSGAINGFESIVSSVWGGISSVIRGGIDDVIGLVNDFISFIDSIQIHVPSVGVGPFHTPSFDWNGLGIPQIPMLAQGGTVTRSGSVIVGDAGPELLNLPKGASVNPLNGKHAATGGGDVNVTINVAGSVLSERQLITKVRDELYKLSRRNNGVGLVGVN